MTPRIILNLSDEDFETLERHVKKYYEGITVEEYVTNVISFYLRIGSYRTVHCPYGCEDSEIKPIGTTSTLLDWPPGDPDPNTYSTEYICKRCESRFWVRRQFLKDEEYVKETCMHACMRASNLHSEE